MTQELICYKITILNIDEMLCDDEQQLVIFD